MSSKNEVPKVSILTITYNQEKYIRQTLDSFLIQKTDFDFEVVITDDCSSDKTGDIIREYAIAHPDIFKATIRTKNVGAWANFLSVLRAAKGTYIAICEGDDYWTDQNKLQLQVDFLDSHPTYALCFHPVKVFFEDNSQASYTYPDQNDDASFTIKDLIKYNFIQTNSVMYRRRSNYDDMPNNIMPGDWYLHLYHTQFGKIGYINKVMSAYRRHPGGIWWESHSNSDSLWQKYGLDHLTLFVSILALYEKDKANRQIIHSQIFDMLSRLAETDNKHHQGLLVKAIERYPELTQLYIINLYKDLKIRIESLQKLEKEADELRQTLHKTNEEVQAIKSTKVWRYRNTVLRLIRRRSD